MIRPVGVGLTSRGPTGVDGLNRAACHACCLLPEVSCEEMNLILDRALLVGTPQQPQLGFLREPQVDE